MATTTNETAIELTHDFKVPADILYKAWTEFEHLQAWWRPMGAQLAKLTNDLRPGGAVVYEFENYQGHKTFIVRGEYRAVEPGRYLEYTWNWEVPNEPVHDGNFLLQITFEDAGSGSRLRVRQDQFHDAESVQPHREGWDSALSELDRYLEQL